MADNRTLDEKHAASVSGDIGMLKQFIMAKILRMKQGGAEEISKTLPSPVMPREAVEQKRAQYAKIDTQTRD
jgi:hypothetical protein